MLRTGRCIHSGGCLVELWLHRDERSRMTSRAGQDRSVVLLRGAAYYGTGYGHPTLGASPAAAEGTSPTLCAPVISPSMPVVRSTPPGEHQHDLARQWCSSLSEDAHTPGEVARAGQSAWQSTGSSGRAWQLERAPPHRVAHARRFGRRCGARAGPPSHIHHDSRLWRYSPDHSGQ